MIDLKEPCKNCQGIDRCIKAVTNTINNIPTGSGRDVVRCIHFANFEYALMTCVFEGISEALIDCQATISMDNTYKTLEQTIREANMHPKCAKKIKVSSSLFNYMSSLPSPFQDRPKDIPDGKLGYFTGIPIEVDDEIDGHYEFVY